MLQTTQPPSYPKIFWRSIYKTIKVFFCICIRMLHSARSDRGYLNESWLVSSNVRGQPSTAFWHATLSFRWFHCTIIFEKKRVLSNVCFAVNQCEWSAISGFLSYICVLKVTKVCFFLLWLAFVSDLISCM